MSSGQIRLPDKLKEIFLGDARYRVAYGGRGSGKSISFALMLAVRGYCEPIKILCCREQQNSIKDSVFGTIKIATDMYPWLSEFYEFGESYIRGKNGTSFIFKGLKRNIEEIKSTAGVKICWVEEADSVSEKSWRLLIPTIREEESEIWVTFNPLNETDPTAVRFIHNTPDNSKISLVNWSDNPWFPEVLHQERLNDQKRNSLFYDHIWEGKFLDASGGLWFPKWINWIKYEDIPKGGEIGRFWDLAYSESDSADRTAGVITKRMTDGRIFQWGHYVARHQWPTMKQKIIQMANKDVEQDKVRRIRVDSTMSQVGYLNDLQTTRELSRLTIEGKRHSTNKIQNAMPYISRCEAGIVHWVDTPMAREFAKEMGLFSPTVEHDDCMDAVANGFDMVSESRGASFAPAF